MTEDLSYALAWRPKEDWEELEFAGAFDLASGERHSLALAEGVIAMRDADSRWLLDPRRPGKYRFVAGAHVVQVYQSDDDRVITLTVGRRERIRPR